MIQGLVLFYHFIRVPATYKDPQKINSTVSSHYLELGGTRKIIPCYQYDKTTKCVVMKADSILFVMLLLLIQFVHVLICSVCIYWAHVIQTFFSPLQKKTKQKKTL